MTQKTQDSNSAATRRPLSTDLIVRAAMGLLDRSGPEGLTFRILASELNVGVASLYTHIDGKSTLLLKCLETLVDEHLGSAPEALSADSRVQGTGGQDTGDQNASGPGAGEPGASDQTAAARDDRASSEAGTSSPGGSVEPAERPWARQLVEALTPVYELCDQHPWLALVSDVVPTTGSDLGMPLWNRVAAVVHTLGFDDEQTFILTATLVGHLTSLMDQRMRAAYITGPLLEDADAKVEPRAFQMSSVYALRRAGAFSREHFDAGLQVIIDGIEAQAARLAH